MNVAMWDHPITSQQLKQIISFGITSDKSESCVHIIPPQEKMLACGEVGIGAMAEVSLIVETLSSLLQSRLPTT
jgi:phosphopantothenoylcysteine synthetase/decarboxylase